MTENRLIEMQRTILRLKIEKFILFNLWIDYFPEVSGNVYIYGAGMLGKLLLRCFQNKPTAFIDTKEGLKDINGVQTLCVDTISAVQFYCGDSVIVTPVWDFDEISRKLLNICPYINIISLDNILEKI